MTIELGSDLTRGLIGHWSLMGDCTDVSGRGHHGIDRGAELTPSDGAVFNGRVGHIEIQDTPELHLGKGDFSIAARIHTAAELDDVLGDIAGKFDTQRRKGFNFYLQNFHGVASGQPNYRNLFFGIDDGVLGSWSDCGRAGKAWMVWALCVYRGKLYAATFEPGRDEAGHVYRYDGGTVWTDCGYPYLSNAVTSLAVFDGQLYAAISCYRSGGSALPDSQNKLPGGKVFRYEGGTRWADCGQVGDIEAIGGLAVFKGQLYASSMYAPAGMFRYEGGQEWSPCGHPGGRVEALGVYNGALYGSGWDLDYSGVFRYDGGTAWTACGTPTETTQTYSFAVYGGALYAGTWPAGKVARYAGGETWEDCGQLDAEQEVMGMTVYNGKLYAGTLPLAEVYRYDGDGTWASTGRLDETPDVKYRRAWSMGVYQGKLFCGTLPSGHVYALEAGKCVTHDDALEPGWRHVAAIRRGGSLELFVDGQSVAVSEPFDAGRFDVSNEEPLTIGRGAHDVFCGSIKDVRLYNRALTRDEAAALAKV